MDATIIICTFNRAESLQRTLESLRQMSVPSELKWELVVVDNNSTDNTRTVVEEFVRSAGFNVRYLFEPRQGLCHARNSGVVNAGGEIIAFTDDDALVAREWLQQLSHTFREFNCTGAVGKSVPAWNGLQKPGWLLTAGRYRIGQGPLLSFDLGEETKPTRIPGWGLNMAFRRWAFVKYGFFRTDLDLSGSSRLLGGDTEFGKRLIRAGEKIIYSPKAIVFHPVSAKRITKSYFLSYSYNHGRTCIREERWPRGAVLYLGVPRYLFRGFIANCVRWLASLNRERRFYYKLRAYSSLGEIVEARKLRS